MQQVSKKDMWSSLTANNNKRYYTVWGFFLQIYIHFNVFSF